MWRIACVLLGVGGFLCFDGYREYSVGKGAGSEPIVVNLAELEAGGELPGPYIRIVEHIPCDHEIIYEAQVASGQEQPTASSQLSHCYYPVVSFEHPFAAQMFQIAQAGDFNAVLPPVGEYRVLVKTHRIDTFGALQSGTYQLPETIDGLVINKINSLSEEESNLLRQGFPTLDLANVLIVEEGRKPASPMKWGGMLGGGALLIVIGLLLVLKPMLWGKSSQVQRAQFGSDED